MDKVCGSGACTLIVMMLGLLGAQVTHQLHIWSLEGIV